SVTMWPGSVHFSPHFVTAFLFTARNEWWAACWMNVGCGEVRWTLRVYLSGAEMATFALRALQSSFLESQPLYSCAPLIPYNWYAGSAHSSCESVRSQEKTKSCAVSGSPFVHLPSCRRWNVTLAPFTSQLCARLGTGLRGFGSSLTSGSMMFKSTFDDVVSVASPGSSDGGSAPQAIVIVWSAASEPPPLDPPLELLLLPPPPPATA